MEIWVIDKTVSIINLVFMAVHEQKQNNNNKAVHL